MTLSNALLNPDLPTTETRTDSPPSNEPPTVLRCSTTADFLAALPFLTGFTAENSLFIVLFQGRRAGNVIRIDLPQEESPEAGTDLIEAICKLMTGTGLGAERPAVVITSERTFAESGGAPWRQFARLLRRRFRREGWPLRDLAIVAADGWAGLLDPKSPREGRPLSEIGASAVSAQAREIVGDPVALAELGGLPNADPQRTAAIIGCLTELDRRESARKPPKSEPIGLPTWLHGVARVAGACFEPSDGLTEARLSARLIRASEVPGSWLVVLLAAVTRPEFVIELAEDIGPQRLTGAPVDIVSVNTASAVTADSEDDTRPNWSFRQLLYSLGMSRPEPAKLRHVITVLSEVTAQTPEPRRPGLLALLAWAWWMLGLQSVATQLVESSLAIDPDHEISLMVERLIETPPDWSLQADTWAS